MEALDQKENFIDYISHRPGVQKDGEHGLWDANGKVKISRRRYGRWRSTPEMCGRR